MHEALPALPGGTELDAVDVVGATVEAESGWAVTATFNTVGMPSPRPGMRYMYRLQFHDADYAYELSVDVDDTVHMPLAGAPYESTVRPQGGTQTWAHSVSGTVYVLEKSIVVSAFGWTVPVLDLNPGHEFTIDAVDTFAGPGVVYGPLDSISGPHTLVVGAGCP